MFRHNELEYGDKEALEEKKKLQTYIKGLEKERELQSEKQQELQQTLHRLNDENQDLQTKLFNIHER